MDVRAQGPTGQDAYEKKNCFRKHQQYLSTVFFSFLVLLNRSERSPCKKASLGVYSINPYKPFKTNQTRYYYIPLITHDAPSPLSLPLSRWRYRWLLIIKFINQRLSHSISVCSYNFVVVISKYTQFVLYCKITPVTSEDSTQLFPRLGTTDFTHRCAFVPDKILCFI